MSSLRPAVTVAVFLAACGAASFSCGPAALAGVDAGPGDDAGAVDDAGADDDAGDAGDAGAVDDAGARGDAGVVRATFVTSELLLPASPTEAESYGFNVDGDAQGRVDNAFGGLLSAFIQAGGYDIGGYTSAAVTAGSIVQLHVVDVDGDLTNGSARWTVLPGAPSTPPLFDGTDALAPESAARATFVDGAVVGGAFAGGPGALRVELALTPPPVTPVPLDLVLARVAAHVDALGCAGGKLGGAIPQTELDGVLIPELALQLDERIDLDGCRTERTLCSSSTLQALDLFDANGDVAISQDEVRNNALLQTLLSPDIDTDGDGDPDALSFGAAFACVPATITGL